MQYRANIKFLFVKTDDLAQKRRTKVRRSEVETVLGRGVSVISLHFLYQGLAFSLCVLTVSVFNTWVADKMAHVPEKARKCLLNCGEPESRGSLQTTLIDGVMMKCLITQKQKLLDQYLAQTLIVTWSHTTQKALNPG